MRWLRNPLTIVMAICIGLAAVGCSHTPRLQHAETLTIYIAPNGNDAWLGTQPEPTADGLNGPLATLSAARDLIRERRAAGDNRPVKVLLREGTYFMEQPFVLTPQDSGTAQAPIVYTAYPGETPVLSGGRVLPALQPRQGIYEAVIPEVRDGDWWFAQLFVNRERRMRARTPNEGFLNMDGPLIRDEVAKFHYREGDIDPAWADEGAVEVNALSKWAGFRMPIASVDADERLATFSKLPPPYNWRGTQNARYWIENAPESIDAPGEWRLDPQSGLLQYSPQPGEKPENLELIAPVNPTLIEMQGNPAQEKWVQHVHFKGLTLSHTQSYQLDEGYVELQAANRVPAAVMINGAHHCRFEGNTFRALGNYAVSFQAGCQHNHVTGNHMTDLGAGGIKIGEKVYREEENLHTSHITVSDNHIHNIGVLYPAAIGVAVFQSAHNQLVHNLIHDTYYSAFSVGWTWGYTASNTHHNRVAYNHAYNIGRGILSDMGGIYTLGPQVGTVIENNLFHDISSYDYGGWGLYTDEGSSYITMQNNVVYRCKSAGFHQHYGKENVIRNNILAYNRENQIMRTRNEDHLSFIFERNLVIYDQGQLLGSNWQGDNYQLDYNLYWDERDGEVEFQDWSFEEWQARGQDQHSVIADPMFRNAKQGDFRLPADSPAWQTGFQAIDISEVGPREPWQNARVRKANAVR